MHTCFPIIAGNVGDTNPALSCVVLAVQHFTLEG